MQSPGQNYVPDFASQQDEESASESPYENWALFRTRIPKNG